GRRDREPDRRRRRLHAVRRHARARGLQRRHLPGDGGGQHQLDGPRLQRRQARMPAELLIEAAGLAGGDGAWPGAGCGVSFRLPPGERLALLGPNGGGKTTILRAIGGELRPLDGSLRVAVSCGTVPQTERSRLDYPVSALEVARMGALSRLPWWRGPGRSDR